MLDMRNARHSAWRRRTTVVAVTTLLVLTALLLSAGVASAAIYDPDAEPCWAFFIGGSGAGNDNATDVAKTSKATWVVGQVDNGATNLDASLVRIPTGIGTQPVVNSWDSPAHSNDANYAVAARGSYVYSAGAARNSSNNLDIILIRWSSTTGAFMWAKRYAGAAKMDDEAIDVVIDGYGNAIVCGTTENSSGTSAWVVRKYNRSGDKKWTWTFDGSPTHNDLPREMVVDGANNIYVTGTGYVNSKAYAYTVKLSPKGAKLWTRRYAGPEATYGNAMGIARCPSGGIYVGGNTSTAATGVDMFLLRYTAAGDRKVYARFDADNGGTTQQYMYDLAVASNGMIYGVGLHQGTDPAWVAWRAGGDVYTSMVNFTTGTDKWLAVGADAYGGVYMTGPYDNPSVNPNIRTQRFSVLNMGGGWLYDYDSNGYNREVSAIAVSGLSCAVVGRQYNGVDYDQYVHIWQY
jgi:hypothetical protein